VPPEVLTGAPPPDCTGADVGACRLLELPVELELFGDPPEVPVEPDGEPLSEEPLPEEPLPEEPLPEETDACAEPGSAAATAPATATLAMPTAAVAAFSRFLPRLRSATARVMAYERSCELLMLKVWHIQLEGLFMFRLSMLSVQPPQPVANRHRN
jgi:hypothetical protein